MLSNQRHDYQYLALLRKVMETGTDEMDRTGTGTRAIFDGTMTFDLSDGSIPLLTTKKVHLKSIINELLWFLAGSTNNNDLLQTGTTIWNEWADTDGELGPIYGQQWRAVPTYDLIDVLPNGTGIFAAGTPIDQIQTAIDQIRNNPTSRRIVVSAWNVAQLDQMALPPCHAFFQFFVRNGTLSCKLTQRSCDTFLGAPFNIAQYSILVHMIAKITGLRAGKFVWSGGDVHVYHNHFDQVTLQLSREPFNSPLLVINGDQKEIGDFKFEDFVVPEYKCHPGINAPVAV